MPAETKKDKQARQAEEMALMGQLFKPVEQKAKAGEDPGSVVCAFFKKGQCTKGAKCKFSHDLAKERKGAKKDIYTDVREVLTTTGATTGATFMF